MKRGRKSLHLKEPSLSLFNVQKRKKTQIFTYVLNFKNTNAFFVTKDIFEILYLHFAVFTPFTAIKMVVPSIQITALRFLIIISYASVN